MDFPFNVINRILEYGIKHCMKTYGNKNIYVEREWNKWGTSRIYNKKILMVFLLHKK